MRWALVLVLVMYQLGVAAPLADRVPADAILYVGWQGARAGGPAYDASRLKQIAGISDLGQMREFMQRLAARLGQENRSIAELVEVLTPVVDVAWNSPMALYVGPGTPNSQRVVLIIDAGAGAADTAARLQQIVVKAGSRMTVLQANGLVVLGTGINEGLMNIVAGRVADGSLEKSPDFIAATGRVAKDAAITAFFSVDALRGQLDKIAGNDWRTWSDALSIGGVHYVAHTSGFDGKDWSSQTFVAAPAPRQGIAALFDQQPLSEELLRVIPRDATLVMAGQFDAQRLLKEMRIAIAKGDPRMSRDFERALKDAKSMVGTDIEAELFRSLGSEWAMYAAPDVGGSRAMGWVLVNRLRDVAAAEEALNKVGDAISSLATSALRGSKMTLPAHRVKRGELTVHYLGMPAITPAWTIKDGILYMGLYPQTVVAAANAASGKASILDNPVIAEARKGQATAGIQFVDLPATVGDGYGTALLLSRYVLGFVDMMEVQSPMTMVPPLHELRPLLAPSLAVSWTDDAGWYSRGREPFPGSTILAGDFTISMISPGVMAAIVLPQFTHASADARQSSVLSTTQTIRAQFELYKFQHRDAYPDLETYPNWEQLLQKTTEDGVPSAQGRYGPYLQVAPVNALNGFSGVEVVAGPVEEGDSAEQVGVGWVFDKSQGRVYPTDQEGMIMRR